MSTIKNYRLSCYRVFFFSYVFLPCYFSLPAALLLLWVFVVVRILLHAGFVLHVDLAYCNLCVIFVCCCLSIDRFADLTACTFVKMDLFPRMAKPTAITIVMVNRNGKWLKRVSRLKAVNIDDSRFLFELLLDLLAVMRCASDSQNHLRFEMTSMPLIWSVCLFHFLFRFDELD